MIGTRSAPAGVECIDPSDDVAWLALLEHEHAGLFHSTPWLGALTDAYGLKIRACVVKDKTGAAQAGIPYCEIDDMVGRRVVALPFSDACDPLVSSPEQWSAVFACLQSRGVPVNLRCLANGLILADPSLAVVKRARWHRLPLSSSPEAAWNRVAGGARQATRKAEQAGVEIRRLESRKDLDGFYDLHVALRKQKYRLLAQPPAFFDAIARRFDRLGGWHPLGAFHRGRLIAATIYLRWGSTLYYKFNASANDALDLRPNNLLVWAGIKLACSLGCQTLDLGPSDDDQPGLIRFKRNFGAEEQELRFLRWTPPGWPDDAGMEARRMFADVTHFLTDPEVPDEITGRAGALLYRFFA